MQIDFLTHKAAPDIRVVVVVFVAIDPSGTNGFPSDIVDMHELPNVVTKVMELFVHRFPDMAHGKRLIRILVTVRLPEDKFGGTHAPIGVLELDSELLGLSHKVIGLIGSRDADVMYVVQRSCLPQRVHSG